MNKIIALVFALAISSTSFAATETAPADHKDTAKHEEMKDMHKGDHKHHHHKHEEKNN